MQLYTHFTLKERDSLRIKLEENKSLPKIIIFYSIIELLCRYFGIFTIRIPFWF